MSWLVFPLCIALGGTFSLDEPTRVDEARLTDRDTSGKMGLYGLGLGLELPMVGIRIGSGSSSAFGTGYTLGAAASWEFQEKFALRVYGLGGEAFGSRIWVQYQEDGEVVRSKQDGTWFGVEAGIGATYLFRGILPTWVPYVGLDIGPHVHGYFYRFDETLEKLEGVDEEITFEGWSNNSVNLAYKLGLRAGIRMETLSWLASSLELGFGFTRIDDADISGTIEAREVQGEPESLWTLRLVYSIYLGL